MNEMAGLVLKPWAFFGNFFDPGILSHASRELIARGEGTRRAIPPDHAGHPLCEDTEPEKTGNSLQLAHEGKYIRQDDPEHVYKAPEEPDAEVIVHVVYVFGITLKKIFLRVHLFNVVDNSVPAISVRIIECEDAEVDSQGDHERATTEHTEALWEKRISTFVSIFFVGLLVPVRSININIFSALKLVISLN